MTNIPSRAQAKVSISKEQPLSKSQQTRETSNTSIRESAAALKEMVKTPIMREKNIENLKHRSDGSVSNRSYSSGSASNSGANSSIMRHSVGVSGSPGSGGGFQQDPRSVNRTVSLDCTTTLEGAE